MKQKLLILSICLLSASLTACNGKMTSNYSSNGSNNYKKMILKDTFVDVCNGSKISEAADYDKTAGTISPIAIYYQGDPGKKYQDQSFNNFPKDWMTEYSNAEKNQLVACITVSSRKEKRRCDFPQDGKKYQLIMNDTKYNVKIYEAKTGELIVEKDFNLKADKACPMIQMFSGLEESDDPDYTQPVIDFLKPFVKH